MKNPLIVNFVFLIVVTGAVLGVPAGGNTRLRWECQLRFLISYTFSCRIHGGVDAEEGEFPYIISIRRIANAFKHMCAGVLIDQQWVLTSAFCVSEVGAYSVRTLITLFVYLQEHHDSD